MNYYFGGTWELTFDAPLPLVVDNFSEDEHFSWIHHTVGWDESGWGGVEFESENLSDCTKILYCGPQRRSRLLDILPQKMLAAGDTFRNEWVTRFDPVRMLFTASWTASDGHTRPLVLRALIFFIPETTETTRVAAFNFYRILDKRYATVAKLIAKLTGVFGRLEAARDQRFIATLRDIPAELTGMRLGKFDKPLIHNRRLLKEIYFGTSEQ